MNRTQLIDPNGHLRCEWCATRFHRASVRGPEPRYCKASHRNRASERRRGLLRPGARPIREELPPPSFAHHHGCHPEASVQAKLIAHQWKFDTPDLTKVDSNMRAAPNRNLGHERGRANMENIPARFHVRDQSFHRARPGSLPNSAGLVPSLCGTMIKVHGLPAHLAGLQFRACRRCESLAPLHPLEPSWWDATGQRAATALVEDLRSTQLAVRQALAGARDPLVTLSRVSNELQTLGARLGRPQVPPPALHHRSVT
jgi:hypothetical protein